jgi:hypothetical protein
MSASWISAAAAPWVSSSCGVISSTFDSGSGMHAALSQRCSCVCSQNAYLRHIRDSHSQRSVVRPVQMDKLWYGSIDMIR